MSITNSMKKKALFLNSWDKGYKQSSHLKMSILLLHITL